MNRLVRISLVTIAALGFLLTSEVMAKKAPVTPPGSPEIESWDFLIGSWDLQSIRYSFEGQPIEENPGTARFSRVLDGLRVQEIQSTILGGRQMEVLNVFAFHPENRQWEIARTDSIHHTFSVMRGEGSGDSIILFARNPSPNSDVVRRWTYRKISADRFSLLLEFSTDQGESFFRRNETIYTRRVTSSDQKSPKPTG